MESASERTDMQECIDECMHCYTLCLQTAMNDSLLEGGEHVDAEHFRLLMSCSGMCRTAAEFMLTGSTLHAQLCSICADVCDACAQSCDRVGGLEECAEACRTCAESCRALSSSHGQQTPKNRQSTAPIGDATPVRSS